MNSNDRRGSVARLELDSTPLEHDAAVIFTLDSQLRFCSCNQAWDRFALANGGPHLHRAAVTGIPLLEYISGPVKDFYRIAFERVRATGVAWRHEYQCSSPDTARLFAMTVYPVDDGLMVVNSLCPSPASGWAAQSRLDRDYITPAGVVVMCSNCRRTRRPAEEVWDWIPSFLSSAGQPVSHGLCPPCAEHYVIEWS